MGNIFSTPTPLETRRTVNVPPASSPCLRAKTKPSNACRRVFPFFFYLLPDAHGVPRPEVEIFPRFHVDRRYFHCIFHNVATLYIHAGV